MSKKKENVINYSNKFIIIKIYTNNVEKIKII